MFEDHPRVCGEKVSRDEAEHISAGSPPRVRGKGPRRRVCHFQFGITPACAGKSFLAGSGQGAVRDHPRVCGEKIHCRGNCRTISGSPPRVRGKGILSSDHAVRRRITPACAGKRIPAGSLPQVPPGSPPRVRGKVNEIAIQDVNSGITPACAGKSFPVVGVQKRVEDHPRVCGEK